MESSIEASMAHHPWAFKELFVVKFFHRVFGYIREVFWVKAIKELKTLPKKVINPIYFKKIFHMDIYDFYKWIKLPTYLPILSLIVKEKHFSL